MVPRPLTSEESYETRGAGLEPNRGHWGKPRPAIQCGGDSQPTAKSSCIPEAQLSKRDP
jgi:hypothetical protein